MLVSSGLYFLSAKHVPDPPPWKPPAGSGSVPLLYTCVTHFVWQLLLSEHQQIQYFTNPSTAHILFMTTKSAERNLKQMYTRFPTGHLGGLRIDMLTVLLNYNT